jgi:ABC-type Zn2+ transport system substrate-binding protein/surface adhesin
MNSAFSEIEWDSINTVCDSNEMFEKFIAEFNKVCQKYVPAKKKSCRRAKPRSHELKDLCEQKTELWFKRKRSKFKNKKIESQYVESRKKCAKKIRKAVSSFERELASQAKKNPKISIAT